MRLLITDFDNTLYDWVTFFARSFSAMVDDLAGKLSIDKEQFFDEFKAVHQRYGNSEHPFAILELPSVRAAYGELSKTELLRAVQSSLDAFNAVRDHHLRLYPLVGETLAALRQRGVMVVGHTEASAVNAIHRMRRLGIIDLFDRIYALEDRLEPHPDPAHGAGPELRPGLLRLVPRHERKPNPDLLRDICRREGAATADSWYVGDSIARDISMAKAAGVTAVWARYGTRYEHGLWDILARVTHWTDEDVRRERELRNVTLDTTPDHVIDDFGEVFDLICN